MRLLAALLLYLSLLLADHVPDNLLASGLPETVLAGIDVRRSHLEDLLKALGKPASLQRFPKTEEAAEAIWQTPRSRVHATVNTDQIAYAVTASGKIAKTGRGLSLGQNLHDLQRLYGTRYLRRGRQVTLQWEDGTELRVNFTENRITSFELIAPVE